MPSSARATVIVSTKAAIKEIIFFILIYFNLLIFIIFLRHSRPKHKEQSDNDFDYREAENKPKGIAPGLPTENGHKHLEDNHSCPTGKKAF